MLDRHASKVGANIIAIDRPAIGLSSPQPHRTISDHARDIADLAAHLGCSRHRVIGVSAGGPYALACALHPDPAKLQGVALVAGVQPYYFGPEDMGFLNKVTYNAAPYAPRVLPILSKPIVTWALKMSDETLMKASLSKLDTRFSLVKIPEKDREVLSDPEVLRIFTASFREHFRQGTDASGEDVHLLVTDWGFGLEDINFRSIKLWYAKQDVNIASCTGPELKRRLGDKAELHMEDESHASLVINCGESILTDLLQGA